MVVLIHESENSTRALYPGKDATMKAVFEGDYVCISFNDEETGQEVTVQLHKGTVLHTAEKIKEGLIEGVKAEPPF